jgi:hypothetical protein
MIAAAMILCRYVTTNARSVPRAAGRPTDDAPNGSAGSQQRFSRAVRGRQGRQEVVLTERTANPSQLSNLSCERKMEDSAAAAGSRRAAASASRRGATHAGPRVDGGATPSRTRCARIATATGDPRGAYFDTSVLLKRWRSRLGPGAGLLRRYLVVTSAIAQSR